ncbi:MAG: hypothetical protein R3C27_13350 [Hyphomonadaceae bacterium]
MVIFNRLMAALFAIAFAVVAPIGAVAFNVDKNVLSEPVWHRAIDQTHFAEGIRNIVVEQFGSEPDSPYANLPEEERQQLALALLPDEALQPVLNEMVVQWVAYGRAERDDIVIPASDLIHGMKDRFPAAILAIIADKPVCQDRESYGSFLCRPRPEDQTEFERRLNESTERGWRDASENQFTFPAGARSADAIEMHRAFIQLMNVTPYIAVGLIVLVAFFAVRGVRGMLLWIGVPLMIAGALVIGFAFLGNLMLLDMVSSLPANLSRPEQDATRRLLEFVFGDFVENFMIWGVAGAATGFGMTVGGSFMPRADSATAA